MEIEARERVTIRRRSESNDSAASLAREWPNGFGNVSRDKYTAPTLPDPLTAQQIKDARTVFQVQPTPSQPIYTS